MSQGAGAAAVSFDRAAVDGSLTARFAEQVRAHPDRIAVQTRAARWSYAQLDRRAARVRAALPRRADGAGGRTALLFEHDEHMVAAVVGTVQAGQCYVPLDAAYPADRLRYMVRHAEVDTLITTHRHHDLAAELATSVPVLVYDALPDVEGEAPAPVEAEPSRPAYLLFTSGSTGRPKAVAQSHRNTLYHMWVWTQRLGIGPEDRLSLQSAYSWDSALQDTWGALLNGATLVPVSVKREGIGGVAGWLGEAGVTVYHSTLPLFRAVARTLNERRTALPAVRMLALGGDFIYESDLELYRRAFSADCRLANAYGATESSSALMNVCDSQTRIASRVLPLGWPPEETEVDLLDGAGRKVEGEDEGEIVLRSAFIAPGYWRAEPADLARFGDDPEGGDRRTYATGDLGRRLADGSILLLGRKDFQVKIDGMRVELGEVEGTLKGLAMVDDAVVLAREDEPGDRYLAAYVVLTQGRGSSVEELRAALGESLPDHAVPAVYVFLDALPLTVNSKIDRQALPRPVRDRSRLSAAYVPPRTRLERRLAACWREVLQLPEVGLDDNFFDLGGTSLRLARLGEMLDRELAGEGAVRMVELYRYPTLRALTQHLETATSGAARSRAAEAGQGERVARRRRWATEGGARRAGRRARRAESEHPTHARSDDAEP